MLQVGLHQFRCWPISSSRVVSWPTKTASSSWHTPASLVCTPCSKRFFFIPFPQSSGNLDFPSGCELILTSRLGACQIRLDFLELELPPPDRFGQCAKETAMEIQMLGRDPIFLCGTNSGNHWYFPVLERGSNLLIKGPAGKHFKWNVKVTQIDCR